MNNVKWLIYLLSPVLFLRSQTLNATVFFPYLNGKSSDDLLPYLTTIETSKKLLMFPPSHPQKGISYVKTDNPYIYLRLSEGKALSNRGFQIRIVPGLSDHVRSVSFQSRKHPYKYIYRCEERFLCMNSKGSKQHFRNNASFIERYAMDGSGGRSYGSVDQQGMFLGLRQGKYIRMRPSIYSVDFTKAVSWDLRVMDDNAAVWTRTRKRAEMEHFSKGAVLFSRARNNYALGLVEGSLFKAALTNRIVGNKETRFNIVPALNGDERSLSFESVSMKDYYVTIDQSRVFKFRRYSDNYYYKKCASFHPVAASDGSEAYSFISASFSDHYVCTGKSYFKNGLEFGSMQVRTKWYSKQYPKECSWDLQVLDKNGIFLNTTYEDMKFSMKGPDVLGKEMGISSGDEFVHRTQDVLVSRTLGWIEGLPRNSSCTPTGDRCSMGLVCKNFTCQVLTTSTSDPSSDTAMAQPTEVKPALPSDIGSVCDPNVDTPCINGISCVQQDQQYFCVPETDSPLHFAMAEDIAMFGASKSESSSLRAWEYSSHAQTIVDVMEKDWSKGISHDELCEHSEARCSLGLVCIVAQDNRRRCLVK